MPTTSQIDKLGRRLRSGEQPSEEDLTILAEYQRSLESLANETLATIVSAYLGLFPGASVHPTSRSKQLRSIVSKLEREKTSLASMQDLFGSRLILSSIAEQEALVAAVRDRQALTLVDRREKPSHGYRAVHVIGTGPSRRSVEIQIRSQLQHQWAELSELFDRISPGVKHGTGDDRTLGVLRSLSVQIADVESLELDLAEDDERSHANVNSIKERLYEIIQEQIDYFSRL